MQDDGDGPPEGEADVGPKSLLPYDAWMEDAMRQVVVRALAYAAREGLPGGHHFYLTFRTDHPGTAIPKRVLAQYPSEMTIVLQHQFWDLKVDDAERVVSVGLSFGGVPSQLSIPFDAISAFADPEVQYGLRFSPVAQSPASPAGAPEAQATPPAAPVAALAPPELPKQAAADAAEDAQVVSLDAFRRRPKE